jgi:hypothetical protein
LCDALRLSTVDAEAIQHPLDRRVAQIVLFATTEQVVEHADA